MGEEAAGLAAGEDVGFANKQLQRASVGSPRTRGDVNLVSLGWREQVLAGWGREVTLNPRGEAEGCTTAKKCFLSAAFT